ncbi:hypothetical protein MMC27_008403 [Xylographa pallens]|nr:hypothetical protein [Xylographa pallens]
MDRAPLPQDSLAQLQHCGTFEHGCKSSRAVAPRVQQSPFIEDPEARIRQAVEMLCSEGTEILRDKFINDYKDHFYR